MKKLLVLFTLVFVTCTPVWAGEPSSFDVVMKNYEPIRLALLQDSIEGVKEHSKTIATELKALQSDFSDERVGTSDEVAMVVKEKLPAMIDAANALTEADSLESARNAFYQLSLGLVRWQEGRDEGTRPSVAYCPMHKKSWLQPGEKIGNPYGGMPGCGTIVSK